MQLKFHAEGIPDNLLTSQEVKLGLLKRTDLRCVHTPALARRGHSLAQVGSAAKHLGGSTLRR